MKRQYFINANIIDPHNSMNENGDLAFEILRNDSMETVMGGTSGVEIPFYPVHLWLDENTPNQKNVSAYVALTGKTVNIKDAYEEEGFDFLPLYKENDDEKDFITTLLKQTVALDQESEHLIEEMADNWELDRIAKMDVLLLKMAFAELQSFESIPTKVTINEYLEISKYYSTPKSNVFINGILDKSLKKLVKEKRVLKTGRGLKQ